MSKEETKKEIKKELQTPSVLSFERKIDPSDACFYACSSGDYAHLFPIRVREKAVRGTISNRLKTKDSDSAKLDAKIENPNLQKIDIATLPEEYDTLKTKYSLKILGGVGIPSACNNTDYEKKLSSIISGYIEKYGFRVIASRLAYNIACARPLWRNRIGAEKVEVHITQKENDNQKKWIFNALSLPLRTFEPNSETKKSLEELSLIIENGLKGNCYVLFNIETFAKIGSGQEVFPSQELILDNDKSSPKGKKSRTLYSVNDIAAMHSQKIGNALRTFDTWYSDGAELGPIAIEPYGSVTSQGKAYRTPNEGKDFYSLLDKWVLKDIEPKNENDKHFVMGILIRGGVFGESEKKEQ